MSGRWRKIVTPIIADVIARVGKEDLPKLREALREAYPFGVRAMWPYKVWLSEVKRQLRQNGIKVNDAELHDCPLWERIE